MTPTSKTLHRRTFVHLWGTGLIGIIAGCAGRSGTKGTGTGGSGSGSGTDSGGSGSDTGGGGSDSGTPEECIDTRADIEGPYYREDIPERDELDTVLGGGTMLTLTGQIVDNDCQPIPGARIDFWQADVDGAYDFTGSSAHFYGYQEADEEGRYAIQSIVPGRYLNNGQYRPAHIHVKIFVDGEEQLTTQLYFEGDPYNEVDPWWSPETTITLDDDGDGGMISTFDFTVS